MSERVSDERLAELAYEASKIPQHADLCSALRELQSRRQSPAGVEPAELSGDTGQLIDRMAEAIRGDTVCDDTPWEALSEDRKIGWRGDAERALAVVKEHLTASHASSPPTKAVTITDEMVNEALSVWRDYEFAEPPLRDGPRMRAALTAAISSEGQSNG